MRRTLTLFLMVISLTLNGQGYNHQWFLGNNPFVNFPNGRLYFDSVSSNLVTEFRKMPFKGTEANISNLDGNILMYTNGVWIANASNDTMPNGAGLNPNGITPNWPNGLPMTANAVFIPYPGDTNKYILFHHTATDDGYSYPSTELYYSVVDMTLDGGLGDVAIKNQIVFSDTLNWGIGACKHANGRDWWIIMSKHNTDTVFKVLVDTSGIQSVSVQDLNVQKNWYNSSQMVFTKDGTKFSYTVFDSLTTTYKALLFYFDRCLGILSNPQSITLCDNDVIWGSCFSPSGDYLYEAASNYIFQIDVNTLTVDTVAMYDGFISPVGDPCCATTFWNMYLAANGKIYITSGSSVQHLHVINYPDSAGLASDVQQHAIDLVDYLHLRAVPNHPNYYLGCDTTSGCACLTTGLNEMQKHDFRFSVSPNPVSNEQLKIVYLLPQNKKGVFEIFDVNGKSVFSMPLPQWSTLQNVLLPDLGNGIYNCSITSGNERVSKKMVVMKQ